MAVAQQFIRSQSAENSRDAVNVSLIESYSTLDLKNRPNGQADEFQIVFSMKEGAAQGNLRTIVWKYDDSGDRDTAFTAVETAITQALT